MLRDIIGIQLDSQRARFAKALSPACAISKLVTPHKENPMIWPACFACCLVMICSVVIISYLAKMEIVNSEFGFYN